MSQEELAARIGVTQSMISQWENGESDIPFSTVHDIARALDTTIERLLRDPSEGEDFYRVWEQLPLNERPRALRILRNLTD
jgi:transcriptional regulator with XRE-family HTH domain